MRKIATGLFVTALFCALSVTARQLPNIDALATKSQPGNAAAIAARLQGFSKAGAPIQVEPRLGVPTFLWAGRLTDSPSILPGGRGGNTTGRPEEAAARAHLANYAAAYNLTLTDVADASVRFIHNIGQGPIIVKFQMLVGGIEVFREELNVVMSQKSELIAITGYLSSEITPAARPGGLGFALDQKTGAASAFTDLAGGTFGAIDLQQQGAPRAGYTYYTVTNPAAGLVEPIRVKPVYFHYAAGLEPAYYVEVTARSFADDVADVNGAPTSQDSYSYVISAVDSVILFRKNLTADAVQHGKIQPNAAGDYTYRVWADPSTFQPLDGPEGNDDSPKVNPVPDGIQIPYVAPSDVTLSNIPFSRSATDPWLPSGAVETVGNNADAYVDLVGPDGYTPPTDFRSQITGPNQFLHTFDPTLAPISTEQRMAALQQLFYNNNFLHDWYYDSGFDETAGNAQASNFGRGGVEGDSIKAEGQDSSGRNNANMNTPADGGRPRMQMFIFDANVARFFEVVSPAGIAGKQAVGTGQFGAQTFNVTNTIVQPSPASGCTAASYTGTAGQFVLVDREPTSTCSIGTKLNFAMAAGAAGFVLVNLSTTPDQLVSVTGSLPTFTIPFLTITWNGAASIKTQLAVPNVVTSTMRRDSGIDRDGTIDNQVIFHEWCHYLSNRLIGNAAGISTNQSGGMGEGWSDFNAMILTARPEDTAVASNSSWNGTYSLAGYVTGGNNPLTGSGNDAYYYGIRRYPYSTDMTKNPLTFRDIQNGVPLPVGPPVAFGANGASNAEVHNTGEVWANTLWECYASLLRDTVGATPRLTFAQARDRMKTYLVASLKMTPNAPTFVEARDAMLAAAYATDVTDYVEFWQAFAKRGLGLGAAVADRYTTDNSGLTESFTVGAELLFVSATLDDSVVSCDTDGVLDAGDTGKLIVTLKNTGSEMLSNTTGTITSTNPNITISGGGALTFSPTDPNGLTTASVNVTMAPGTAGVQSIDYSLSFNDPDLAIPGPRTASGIFRGNSNIISSASATDTVEAPREAWTKSFATGTGLSSAFSFARKEISGVQHDWFGPDAGTGTDIRLTSPLFTVDGSGSMNLQFDHSFGFEFDAGGNYDGGVVEMSVNGGAFADIGTPAYTGVIVNYTGDVNPLKTRSAFVQNSGGTRHASLTQAIAPGSTVQVRFRIGSDGGVGAAGWDIDNIAFTGVVETPFDVIVADSGCTSATATTLSVSPTPSSFGSTVTLTATVNTLHGPATGGTVTFFDGTTSLGSAPVMSGGMASITTSSLTIGSHSLKASFSGSSGFVASDSSVVTHLVNKAASTTTLTAPAKVNVGASALLSAVVSGVSTPEGSVTFMDGSTVLAVVTLTSGQAQFSATLSPGDHSVTATYGGNATFSGSVSSAQTVNVDRPPVFNALSDKTVAENSLLSFTVSAPDQDGDTVSYSVTNAPSGSSFNTTTGQFSWTPDFSQAGTYPNVTFAANDGRGGTASVSITITVTNMNRPPVLNAIGNQSGAENSALTFTVSASDPDGDTLTYGVTNLPTGATFNTSTGAFAWTPDFNQAGTYPNITFSVSDGMGGTASETITITIANTNRAPVFASIGGRSIRGPNQISFAVSASDPDGDSFTLSAMNLPAGSTFNPADGTFSWAPTRSQIGSYQVTFQATDSNNAVGAETITISVTFAASDFDGDSHGDILLTDQSGTLVEWQMNGFSITAGGVVGTPGSDWRVAATGDFNGDGRTDVILQNNTTGDIVEWQMNGSVISAGAVIGSLGTNWQVATAGDFNGDGRSDLILQNTSTGDIVEWQMNGFSVSGGAIIATLPTTWTIAGAGDFDADGHSDLVLQNSTTNEVVVWLMNGLSITSGRALATPASSWKVTAVGDFNGDGKSDVVLQNNATRAVAEWQCDGAMITSGLVISTPAPGWVVRGTADYNSDGRSDLLLGNTNSGDVAVWQMNGFSFAGAVVGTPGPAFTPVGK